MMLDVNPVRYFSLAMLLALFLWESVHPYFNFFRGHTGQRFRHAGRNVALGLLNILMVSFLFMGMWQGVSGWAEKANFGILHWISLPVPLSSLMAILLFDAWTYAWHRANHVVPFLWRFHRVHHLDEQMDVTSANRFHFGEIAMSSALRVALIPIFGVSLEELAIYETLLLAVVQFHHANIGLPQPLERWLRYLIVTPAMHKIHHSRYRPETDSNYTSLFSFWDRIFGSFRMRQDPHTIRFGLEPASDRLVTSESLRGLLWTPWNLSK